MVVTTTGAPAPLSSAGREQTPAVDEAGLHVSLERFEPEPTMTADGAWWHPVAVTDPNLTTHDAPLPLSEVVGVVRDTLAVQDAASTTGREVSHRA